MAILTAQESINGGAAARARNAEREARAELVAFIETTYILTVKGDVMEFTSPFSPIIPMVVVQGSISGGVAWMRTEAGPGQRVSANTLAACETVALGRLQANRAARLAEGQAVMNSNSQANNRRQPMTATSRAYRDELLARPVDAAQTVDAAQAVDAAQIKTARIIAALTSAPAYDVSYDVAAHLRRYVESGGTSGKGNDPYTDEELGLR